MQTAKWGVSLACEETSKRIGCLEKVGFVEILFMIPTNPIFQINDRKPLMMVNQKRFRVGFVQIAEANRTNDLWVMMLLKPLTMLIRR